MYRRYESKEKNHPSENTYAKDSNHHGSYYSDTMRDKYANENSHYSERLNNRSNYGYDRNGSGNTTGNRIQNDKNKNSHNQRKNERGYSNNFGDNRSRDQKNNQRDRHSDRNSNNQYAKRENVKDSKNNPLFSFIPSSVYNPETKKVLGILSAEDLLLIALILMFLDNDENEDPLLIYALLFILVSDWFDIDFGKLF